MIAERLRKLALRVPALRPFFEAGRTLREALYLLRIYAAAFVWRRLMVRTKYIAITGSVGKTTTKECLASILSQQHPTVRTYANQNDLWGVPRSLLKVRPRHRFAVIEVGSSRSGQIRLLGRLVKPDVAVVLGVKLVHRSGFGTLEKVAEEKAALLGVLRPGGVGVVNLDDPLVAAMPVPAGVEVLRFGSAPSAEVRWENASSRWPRRLGFHLHYGGRSHRVQSRLVGTHWVPTLLGGITAALASGVSATDAIAGAEQLAPFMGRMEPVELPSGAVMLRDDKGGQIATLEPAIRVIEESQAARRIVVLGDYGDSSRKGRRRMRDLGELAARVADLAVFVDSKAEIASEAAIQSGMDPANVHPFSSLEDAAEFLRKELRSGDLVLLKGRIRSHLARLYYSQIGSVGCWKHDCRYTILCDVCHRLKFRPDPLSGS